MSSPRPVISILDDSDDASSTSFASLTLPDMANLIRSLSSFLAITTSISDPIKQLDKNHRLYQTLSRLDRIATLLITKDGSDVAAVIYSGSFNSTEVVGIAEQSESGIIGQSESDTAEQFESGHAGPPTPPIENLFAIKNSKGNDNDQTGRILPPRISTDPKRMKKIGRQMDTSGNTSYLKGVLESGPLSLPEHAQFLEKMFNQHLSTGEADIKRHIVGELKFCTYFQCRAKILQRLTVRLHPRCPVGFLDVFGTGAVDEDKLKDGCNLIDQLINADNTVLVTLMHYDERMLYKRMFAYTKFDFKFDNQHHLILDSESCTYFHTYICNLLSLVVENLQQLKAYTNPAKNKAKGYERAEAEARGLLTAISRNFSHLANLVNQSPTFHKHMRNPAILEWFVGQATANLRGNQVYNKNIRYILEDEEALNSVERIARDTHGSFMKWLQLSTQWTQTIADLTNFIVTPITMTILEPPCTMQSNWQTPLDGLLKFVLDKCSRKNLGDIKRNLQKVARSRSQSQLEEFPGDWRRITVEEWDKWAHNFAGKMHCEAMLACLKRVDLGKVAAMSKRDLAQLSMVAEKLQKCEPLIGCSKACCLCCSIYVRHSGKLRCKGSSGRIFPWVIPVWETDRAVYEKILKELKSRVWVSLRELGVLTIDRRHSGSDKGSCPIIYCSDSDLEE